MLNNLSFTDSVSFPIKDLGIESAAIFMASHNASFEEYCFPSAQTRRLTIDHKFSIGFRSGELGGQIIIVLFLKPIDSKYCVVALAA